MCTHTRKLVAVKRMGMEWGGRSLASCLEEMNYRCKSCAETKKVTKIDIFFQESFCRIKKNCNFAGTIP